MRVQDEVMVTGRRDSQASGAAYDHARLERRWRLLRWVADNIGFRPARWRQSGVVVRLGRPFRFRPFAGRLPRERLRQMTDEAMYILAAMLLEARRGVCADLSAATTETIEFV